ncbi:MAG: DNA-directed DNA polymerase II small subunit [Candidatus Nanoarchaeia archaeon]|nr:DNA-directed DNA polymerase II small subunit [Candidatus Nanoarchaeia archaeon]MDD5239313.1 DNA-directed DNA polymerase II small subunit [Candidatus Nanoarchaeia archaeon]
MENVVARLIEKGFLVSPDLKELTSDDLGPFLEYLAQTYPGKKPSVISKEIYTAFVAHKKPVEVPKTESEPGAEPELEETYEISPSIKKREKIETKMKIRKQFIHENRKVSINDWVTYYFDRYNKLRDILQNREELKNTISIGRAIKSTEGSGRQQVSLIGMIKSLRKAFSGTTIMELEDPTGIIKVAIKKPELAQKVEELVEDEVIGLTGSLSKDIVFAENIVFPEIPERPIKKSEDDVSAVFLSDIHLGSNMFLPNEFTQCIKWISGELGNTAQRQMAEKIRYMFIAGDMVDGVGIYPGQESELLIPDIFAQYKEFADYIAKIPQDIHIVMIPGNHDTVRIAEPQPILFRDIAEKIYTLPNVTVASNPATVNMHNIGAFPGFDVLLYHGYSFDHYVANSPYLMKHGYNRADLIQEFLLRKRHLAPTHGSTLIDPGPVDHLVIDKIPDIFVTGHIHKTKVGRYRNILNLNCGCFQDKTAFQEKVGHTPEPGRVPVFNLKSGETKLMRFR